MKSFESTFANHIVKIQYEITKSHLNYLKPLNYEFGHLKRRQLLSMSANQEFQL